MSRENKLEELTKKAKEAFDAGMPNNSLKTLTIFIMSCIVSLEERIEKLEEVK